MIGGVQTRLRPLAEGDLEAVLGWRNAVRDRFIDDRLLTMADQRRWFARYRDDSDDQAYVIEALDGHAIGLISLAHVDTENGTAELGRMLIGDPEYIGRGYASDAARALIGDAFDRLRLHRLYLYVLESNASALALYAGLGFARQDSTAPEELPGRGRLLLLSLDRSGLTKR
jgi:RimJ/RimL family protein N-acetyltransferase